MPLMGMRTLERIALEVEPIRHSAWTRSSRGGLLRGKQSEIRVSSRESRVVRVGWRFQPMSSPAPRGRIYHKSTPRMADRGPTQPDSRQSPFPQSRASCPTALSPLPAHSGSEGPSGPPRTLRTTRNQPQGTTTAFNPSPALAPTPQSHQIINPYHFNQVQICNNPNFALYRRQPPPPDPIVYPVTHGGWSGAHGRGMGQVYGPVIPQGACRGRGYGRDGAYGRGGRGIPVPGGDPFHAETSHHATQKHLTSDFQWLMEMYVRNKHTVRTRRSSTRKRTQEGGEEEGIRRFRPRKIATYWTREEEKILKDQVQKHGNRWALILSRNQNVFHGRTPGNLKDKWRNLTNRSNNSIPTKARRTLSPPAPSQPSPLPPAHSNPPRALVPANSSGSNPRAQPTTPSLHPIQTALGAQENKGSTIDNLAKIESNAAGRKAEGEGEGSPGAGDGVKGSDDGEDKAGGREGRRGRGKGEAKESLGVSGQRGREGQIEGL
ncbi:hypothetical protein AAMO2058_001398300 [Amorphochlora amoebiformis]